MPANRIGPNVPIERGWLVWLFDETNATFPQFFVATSGSGGPVILHKVVNGIQRFFPVGVIIRGPGRALDEAEAGDRSALGDFIIDATAPERCSQRSILRSISRGTVKVS
jgi:hypothetical protein